MSNIPSIEKRYIALLNNPQIKIISFDIFDTLVFRKVQFPVDIFYEVGNNSYVRNIFHSPSIFQQFRIEAEKQARFTTQNEETTLKEIYAQLPLSQQQQNKLISLEIEYEYNALYINKQVEQWIQMAIESKKQVIFITDIYFDRETLEHLVFSKMDCFAHDLYLSSEIQKTKHTGTLFEEVLKTLNITGNNILHIGDNALSDITNTKRYGINSLHYNVSNETSQRFFLENRYMDSLPGDLHNIRKLASLQNPFEDKSKQFFFDIGATLFGSIIWDMCHWLLDIKSKYKIKQINFVMREGRLFEKFIKKIEATLDTNLIFASRKSTFLISLDEQKIKKGEFEFYGYEDVSIQSLYQLYGLNILCPEILEVKDFILKKTEMFTPKQDQVLRLVSRDFSLQKNNIIANIKKQKELFSSYLRSINYTNNSILVEFGGTGTIPANIHNSLPKNMRQKINVLFYMHQKGVTKMLNKRTFSFIPFDGGTQKEIDIIGSIPAVMEILFNGTYTTTLSYEQNIQGTQPVLQEKNHLFQERDSLIEAFDLGIEKFFDAAKIYGKNGKFLSPQISLKILSRLIDVPTFEEASLLGDLLHESGHGSNNVHPIVEHTLTENIRAQGIESVYKKFTQRTSLGLGTVYWVPAHVTRIEPLYIAQTKGFIKISENEIFIENICRKIDLSGVKKVSIYGAGFLFEALLPSLKRRNICIEKVIDKRAEITKFEVAGYKVFPLSSASLKDGTTVVIASNKFQTEIVESLQLYSKENNIRLDIL